MIPNARAGVADSSIVLGSRHQPFPCIRITAEIFDLADAKAFVECCPIRAAVCRSENPSVIAGIYNIGVSRRECETVLVRVDAVGALRGHVGPCPTRAGESS